MAYARSRIRIHPASELASSVARGAAIPATFHLIKKVVKANPNRPTQIVSSLVLEIGPSRTGTKIVVSRRPTAAAVAGHVRVVAEDFGYRVTSSLAVVESSVPIEQEAVDRVAGHNGVEGAKKIGKTTAKAFLETHVAPPTVRTLETLQFDGTGMINNGSKGQYIRRSEDKLAWRGIPCIRVPSHWTSSTDTRHAKVDKRQRKGRTFVAAADGRRSDADVHAAETIGRYLFLVPKTETMQAARM